MQYIKLTLLMLVLSASTSWAAPISVDIDKDVNLALGTRSFGPVAVPDDASACTFSVNRANWQNASATMSASLEMSVDNGPFTFWLGMTSRGSAVDAQAPLTKMSRPLPDGINRRVQGSYVVSGARFISTVSVACS